MCGVQLDPGNNAGGEPAAGPQGVCDSVIGPKSNCFDATLISLLG
jgi:hypothetical protein